MAPSPAPRFYSSHHHSLSKYTPFSNTLSVGGTPEAKGTPEVERVLVQRIALLRQAIALDPDLLGAHYHLGRLLATAGDYEAGLAALRVAGHLAVADFDDGKGKVVVDGVQLDQVFAVTVQVGAAGVDRGMSVTRAEFDALYAAGADALYALVQAQATQLAVLTARVGELEPRLGGHSQNG